MKKIVWILGVLIAIHGAYAKELYHGIDIDDIYRNGDWDKKESIYQIIDDFGLFIELQQEFKECSTELPNSINCYDRITEKILKNFYKEFEVTWSDYIEFKKILMKVYAVPSCQDKFSGAGGELCNVNTQLYVARNVKRYVQALFASIYQIFSENYSFLHHYQ